MKNKKTIRFNPHMQCHAILRLAIIQLDPSTKKAFNSAVGKISEIFNIEGLYFRK